MASQSVPEFADESFRQVEQFNMHGYPPRAYKDIFVSLKQTPQDKPQWSESLGMNSTSQSGTSGPTKEALFITP
jgi:hypothetical protein